MSADDLGFQLRRSIQLAESGNLPAQRRQRERDEAEIEALRERQTKLAHALGYLLSRGQEVRLSDTTAWGRDLAKAYERLRALWGGGGVMAWWTKIDGVVKRHDGRKPKLGAAIEISFARAAGKSLDSMHLYKQDPERHPGAEDHLPALLLRARKGRRR